MEFEWDAIKEELNIRKHGVAFPESVEAFFDPNGFQMIDHDHSEKEERFYWIGKTEKQKVLTTWFTLRGEVIRIIGSAEFRKFRRLYERTQIK